MEGSRWQIVCQCIDNLTKNLGEDDLVGCIVFNEEPEILKLGKNTGYTG